MTTAIDPSRQSVEAQPPDNELDVRARKRMEVGLAPRRPTAKSIPQRPPDVTTLPLPPLALALTLVAVLLATGLLVAANLGGGLSLWLPSRQAATTPLPGRAAPSADYVLRLADDFSQSTSPLTQGAQPEAWQSALLPAESVYAMQVWPNHLAWSLLGGAKLGGYRLQASVEVDATTPSGFAGLMVRFQDERHFYLLAVDGSGRYQVQRQEGEQAEVILPWRMADFLNRAGSANILTAEDDGSRLRFYGNGMLLAEVEKLVYPLGNLGLAAGGLGQGVAEVRFDWFQLYDAAIQ